MYYFYMGSVLLPIAPEKFTLKVNNANKTITLINEGEVNLLKQAKLTELEFDALIPAVQYSFANYDGGFKSPTYFTNHFEKLKTEKKPFQFIITRKMPDGKLLFDTNMTVSLESYTIKEDVKQGFDLLVSFKLKQYRTFGTKVLKVSNDMVSVSTARPTTNSPEPKKETTYTVQKGDTLWGIAKKFYGNGSKYTKIYGANKDKIKNPNLIYPKQVLVIPDANSVNSTKTTSTKNTKKSNEQSTQQTEKVTSYSVIVNCLNPMGIPCFMTMTVYNQNGKLVSNEEFYPTKNSPALKRTVTVGYKVVVEFHLKLGANDVSIVNSTSNWAGLTTTKWIEAIDKDSEINFKWVTY